MTRYSDDLMRAYRARLLILAAACALLLCGCSHKDSGHEAARPTGTASAAAASDTEEEMSSSGENEDGPGPVVVDETPDAASEEAAGAASDVLPEITSDDTPEDTSEAEAGEVTSGYLSGEIRLEDIPEFTGDAFVVLNGNRPLFTDEEITVTAFEEYYPLDDLGRASGACACLAKELMPTEERGLIGSVQPAGWHTVKYDGIDGAFLYNRCHLIGYQLTGENDNENNLMTGTRYMNVEGMQPFENRVAWYVRRTGNHVMYRVTPLYKGDDLLASGVLIESYCVEDPESAATFCVFCYNVQPGIEIDHDR